MTKGVTFRAKRVIQRGLRRWGYVLRQIDYPDRVGGIDLFIDLGILIRQTTTQVMFDVGANQGQTIARLREIDPSAVIYAFEPSPPSFKDLEESYGQAEHVHLENVALGEADGTAEFYVTATSVNDSLLKPTWDFTPDVPLASTVRTPALAAKVPVQLTTLDRYCAEHAIEFIDFLKIDTQGYDLRVLRGGCRMLTERRVKAVAVELTFVPMYSGQGDYIEILTFLDSLEYRLMGFYEQTYRQNTFIYCNALFVA